MMKIIVILTWSLLHEFGKNPKAGFRFNNDIYHLIIRRIYTRQRKFYIIFYIHINYKLIYVIKIKII